MGEEQQIRAPDSDRMKIVEDGVQIELSRQVAEPANVLWPRMTITQTSATGCASWLLVSFSQVLSKRSFEPRSVLGATHVTPSMPTTTSIARLLFSPLILPFVYALRG